MLDEKEGGKEGTRTPRSTNFEWFHIRTKGENSLFLLFLQSLVTNLSWTSLNNSSNYSLIVNIYAKHIWYSGVNCELFEKKVLLYHTSLLTILIQCFLYFSCTVIVNHNHKNKFSVGHLQTQHQKFLSCKIKISM